MRERLSQAAQWGRRCESGSHKLRSGAFDARAALTCCACDAGITALHTAVLKGRSAVVVALLKHPTLDPNVNTTLKGDTPVHLAAGGHGKRRHKMLRLLLADPRTDSNVVNSQGVKAAVPRQACPRSPMPAASAGNPR
eukprot:gene33786-biopygen36054